MAVLKSSQTTTSCRLKRVPQDVFKIVLEQQTKEKVNRGTKQFSFEATVYKIIREFKRCQDQTGYEASVGK